MSKIKAQSALIAHELAIRQNAVAYRIHLFLGRGEYDRAEASTPAEALSLGAQMVAAHPVCNAKPLFYAIDASGASTMISRKDLVDSSILLSKEPAMLKLVNTYQTYSKPANARRGIMRFRDAHPELESILLSVVGDPCILVALIPPGTPEDHIELCRNAGMQIQVGSQGGHAPAAESKKEAHAAEARLDVSNAAEAAEEDSMKKNTAKKPAKAPKTSARAAKPPRAVKTAEGPAKGKRAEILAAAEAGKLPAAPDFSADTHARFRGKLDALVALVKAKDINGLKAYPINPISSSPKALDRYRNLAVIALTAKAKQAA